VHEELKLLKDVKLQNEELVKHFGFYCVKRWEYILFVALPRPASEVQLQYSFCFAVLRGHLCGYEEASRGSEEAIILHKTIRNTFSNYKSVQRL
jgi:hypothetical protein